MVDFAYLSPDVTHAADTIPENPNQRLIPPKATLKQIENKQQEIQKENEKQINGVLNYAIQKSGPVHLNVPMEEPLYGMTTSPIEITQNTAPELSHPKVDFKTFKKNGRRKRKSLCWWGSMIPTGLINSGWI